MYKLFVRPIAFLMKPENAHHTVVAMMKVLCRIPGGSWILRCMFNYQHERLETNVLGIKFKNPVGLAAGFDKDASFVDEFSHLGFSFIEIGTLTPKAQPGNPKPRLFRLTKDRALINRMGFNNEGVEKAVKRLRKRKSSVIVGGNIGKNKVTSNEEAYRDYEICFEALHDYVDYFAVNVSSPNTPNLRELQEKGALKIILGRLIERNKTKKKQKPILLKIAPDLSDTQLDDILDLVNELNLSGIIATNTTISREGLLTNMDDIDNIGSGGLSGLPVKDRSTEVIRYLRSNAKNDFVIIGVGGINSPDDAIEKLKAGASLVQVYTGFIYQGPSIIKEINKRIKTYRELTSGT